MRRRFWGPVVFVLINLLLLFGWVASQVLAYQANRGHDAPPPTSTRLASAASGGRDALDHAPSLR